MNTSRMDTVLIRQKRNLVVDALFALVVIAGVMFYLFGLSASREAVASAPSAKAAPAIEMGTPVEQSALCVYEPGAWRC
jgi:hypothetical protein